MRMSTLPGVTNLVDILNNPNGVGGQKPAPDQPPPANTDVAKILAAKSMQKRKATTSAPQVESDLEELRICITYGAGDDVLFYLDDGDDYENVTDFEVDTDTAKKLIPFFKAFANVRILHKELKAEFPPPAPARKRGK